MRTCHPMATLKYIDSVSSLPVYSTVRFICKRIVIFYNNLIQVLYCTGRVIFHVYGNSLFHFVDPRKLARRSYICIQDTLSLRALGIAAALFVVQPLGRMRARAKVY